jgi:hypothetical protein
MMSSDPTHTRKVKVKKFKTPARTVSHKHPSEPVARSIGGGVANAPDDLDGWDVHGMARPKRQKMEVKMEHGQLVIKLPVNDPRACPGPARATSSPLPTA